MLFYLPWAKGSLNQKWFLSTDATWLFEFFQHVGICFCPDIYLYLFHLGSWLPADHSPCSATTAARVILGTGTIYILLTNYWPNVTLVLTLLPPILCRWAVGAPQLWLTTFKDLSHQQSAKGTFVRVLMHHLPTPAYLQVTHVPLSLWSCSMITSPNRISIKCSPSDALLQNTELQLDSIPVNGCLEHWSMHNLPYDRRTKHPCPTSFSQVTYKLCQKMLSYYLPNLHYCQTLTHDNNPLWFPISSF